MNELFSMKIYYKVCQLMVNPMLGLALHVEEVLIQSAKCMVCSKLCQPAYWPELEGLPSLAQIMIKQASKSISFVLIKLSKQAL